MGGRGTLGGRIIVGGGIGAGKSSVLELLSNEGIFVVEADRIGHDVLSKNLAVRKVVAERWPAVVIDGELSRSAIAAIVFADESELKALEVITHPAIRAAIDAIVENMGDASVALEVPVIGLMGPGWTKVAVIAPVDVRLARAAERGTDPDDIRARMRHQPSDEEWIAWADHVIDNTGDRGAVVSAVARLLEAVVA